MLFATALRDALVTTAGRVPSAAKFADAFNLRAYGTSTITRETARKWLRGDAIPEIGKMRVLIRWLNIDPSTFLQTSGDESLQPDQADDCRSMQGESNVRGVLINILEHLDERSIETLFLTATAMREVRKLKRENQAIDAATLKFVWH